MQMLLLLAYQANDDPKEQEKQKEKVSNIAWEDKLKEAQERSLNRIQDKDEIVKKAQMEILEKIEKEK